MTPSPKRGGGCKTFHPISADDVRHAGGPVVAFSPAMSRDLDALRAFLVARVYRHARIERVMGDAERVVADLFGRYRGDPDALPPEWRDQAPAQGLCPLCLRLHRRHDRPLRARRAPAPV